MFGLLRLGELVCGLDDGWILATGQSLAPVSDF